MHEHHRYFSSDIGPHCILQGQPGIGRGCETTLGTSVEDFYNMLLAFFCADNLLTGVDPQVWGPLPSKTYGSDHVCIGAQFKWRDEA